MAVEPLEDRFAQLRGIAVRGEVFDQIAVIRGIELGVLYCAAMLSPRAAPGSEVIPPKGACRSPANQT